MKKFFSLLAALLLLLSLTACNKKVEEPVDDNKVSENNKDNGSSNTQLANPFTNYATIDELKAQLGYTINSYDELFTHMTDVTYTIMTNDQNDQVVTIEAYKETKDTLITLTLRISDKFEGKIELAGIYNELEDLGVDEEGKHNYQADKESLVTWDEDNIHYSLYTTEVALSSIK